MFQAFSAGFFVLGQIPRKGYGPMQQKIEILLIEDSVEDSALMEKILGRVRDAVFKLETRPSLATGLDCLNEGKVDLVLLDLNLPDSFGMETFMGLHSSHPQIPVILLTGHDDKETALKLVREGAQDYIVKGE
ncbi:MAG: response regulator, partial [Nitrospinota bacterium]